MTSPERFPGFSTQDIGPIHARVGGTGPALLLLHGYPQSHLMWWPVAEALAERFTVVAADLPGYGDSPAPDDFSKRAMARALVEAMAQLGHATFAVAGHDRGGRVAYRMALDHPDAVTRLAVLDIVPTGAVWDSADATFALGYWHWGFLAQAAPLPERLLLGDPDAHWAFVQRMGIKPGDERYPDDVLAAYRARLDDPDAVHAMCEDYRAGASTDRELDAEGGTIACPVLALWGAHGALPVFYDDPLEPWRAFAPGVEGRAIDDASHFLVEDQPAAVTTALLDFLLPA